MQKVAVAKCCQRKVVKTSYLIYVSLPSSHFAGFVFFFSFAHASPPLAIAARCFLFGYTSSMRNNQENEKKTYSNRVASF